MLTMIGTLLSSYRWCSLLALQEVYVSQWQAFRLTMVGVFFNLFGFGGVGGDVFKMWYVREVAGPRTAEAVLSILVDRILGLLGLFCVAIASLPFVWSDLQQASSLAKSMVAFVVGVSVVGGTSVTLVLCRDWWLPDSAKELVRGVARRFPLKLVVVVGRVVRSLDLYRSQPLQLARALAVSGLVHTTATLGVVCIAQAFQIQAIPMRIYFIAVQVANTISAVPITPGGLGSRDLVLQRFLLDAGGDMRCNLIPFGLSVVLVLWSLVGGIFFIFEPKKGPAPNENLDLPDSSC
jgi:uncharacterized membrane protein YbhN (UPF0104 family)